MGWQFWLKVILFASVLIIMYIIYIRQDYSIGILLFLYILAFTGGLYIGKQLKDKQEEIYGSNVGYYDKKVKITKKILKSKDLLHKLKVDILVQQYEEELPKQKLTTYIFRPFPKLFSAGFIPLLVVFLGWVLKNTEKMEIGFELAKILLILLIVLLGFYCLLKVLAEEILDRDYKKMEELKNILRDILIKDLIE